MCSNLFIYSFSTDFWTNFNFKHSIKLPIYLFICCFGVHGLFVRLPWPFHLPPGSARALISCRLMKLGGEISLHTRLVALIEAALLRPATVWCGNESWTRKKKPWERWAVTQWVQWKVFWVLSRCRYGGGCSLQAVWTHKNRGHVLYQALFNKSFKN